jgi:hypothetical protein
MILVPASTCTILFFGGLTTPTTPPAFPITVRLTVASPPVAKTTSEEKNNTYANTKPKKATREKSESKDTYCCIDTLIKLKILSHP